MNWTIEWVFALALTSLSGSILYVAWYLVGKVLERIGFLDAVYEFLKVVLVFFFVPVGYIALKVKEQEIGRGYLFLSTPILLTTGKILIGLWLMGFSFMLAWFVRNIKLNKKLQADTFDCEREVVQQFEETYHALGGKKSKLKICRSYYCKVPCVTGFFYSKLILPVEKYCKEDLEIIFNHEITHYLQGDVPLKWICTFLLCAHYFNPLAWKFYRAIQKWSEFSCDYRACKAVGSTKQYFEVITDIAVVGSLSNCLSSQLTESKNELVERIEKIKMSTKVRFHSKWMAIALSGIAFLTSTVTVSAATVGCAQQYVNLYHATEVENEVAIDEIQLPQYVEYIEYENAEGVVEREGEISQLTRSIKNFEWTVGSNELVKSDAFVAVTGQTINVNVFIDPSNVTLKVGVIMPDGTKWYVTGTEHVSYDFALVTSGTYRVFVENNSSESVDVEGMYNVY